MAVEQKYVDLINAGIDGELSAGDRGELESFLRDSAEGRELQASLTQLCRTLDEIPELSPPPHLQHVILDAVKPAVSGAESTSIWQAFFGKPSVRYAAAFALGVVLTMTYISSDQISKNAFDDVTGLVGTISSTQIEDATRERNSISLSSSNIAGTITMLRAGQIMVIDFDLVSHGPIEIVANFSDPDVWFNGFAQLESTGTSVSAEAGQVKLMMEGKRRYAMYLHNASGDEATVNLSFFSGGKLIHEDVLNFKGADQPGNSVDGHQLF